MTPVKLVAGSDTARRQFEQLVQPHFNVLYRVAFRFTGTEHDAEDLVQETCVRAYRHLDKLSRLDNPRAWLLHVMQNLFIDSTRRYENSNVIPLDAAPDSRIHSNQASPEEAVDAEQATQRIGLCLRKLGKDHRSLLVLHDVEGYSLSELGEITGLKIGTIKSRLHRARVRLGRMLESDEQLAERLPREGSGT